MNAMIEDWRASWRASQNFTFVMAQLAAYIGPDDALPMLRQSQLMATLATPNVRLYLFIHLLMVIMSFAGCFNRIESS